MAWTIIAVPASPPHPVPLRPRGWRGRNRWHRQKTSPPLGERGGPSAFAMGRVRWGAILSPVGGVERQVLRDLGLPTVAVLQQLLLVVEQLLMRLGRELEVRPLVDRIDRTRFLAIAAIDAFRHINVVTGGAPAAILTRLGLDRNCERRADRFA